MKKALAILLAAMFCMSAVACSNTGSTSSAANTSSAADTTSTSADSFAEKQEISIAMWGIGDIISSEEDALRDYVFDKFNVTLTAQPVTWTDADEKIKLWATAKNLPDLTAYAAAFSETFQQWTQQGVVRALPASANDESKYPDLAKLMNSDWTKTANEITDTNTTFYGIPRPNFNEDLQSATDNGLLLRKDWLDELGLSVPTTIDELIDTVKKMMAAHPGTVGITGYNFGWMTFLMDGACPASINGFQWVNADSDDATYNGKVVPVWMTKSFLNGIKQMRACYEAGVLDKDYLLLKDEEGRDKFINDRACAYAHSGTYPGGIISLEQKMSTDKAASHKGTPLSSLIIGMPRLKDADGNAQYVLGDRCWSESYLGINVSDEKAERICALMNWLLSEDGFKTVTYGIPNTDWTEDADGKVTFTLGKDSDGNEYTAAGAKYPFGGISMLSNWSGFRSYMNQTYSDDLMSICNTYDETLKAENVKVMDMPNIKGLVLTETSMYNVLDFNETINKFMTYEGDVDAYWAEFKATQLKNGYDQVIDEMNTLYDARKSAQ